MSTAIRILCSATLLAAGAPLGAQSTVRAVLGVGGAQPDEEVNEPSLSADGRWVAFHAWASNLVPDDLNGELDVFLLDRVTGEVRLVSRGLQGQPSDGFSYYGVLAPDGTHLVFRSVASNLVPGDTNGHSDVFLYELATGVIERVSLGADGVQGNQASKHAEVSGDARLVAFRSSATNLVQGDTNHCDDIFVRDRAAGQTRRASVRSDGGQANGPSAHAVISADGAWVAFRSHASNLGDGDTNGVEDVFLHELASGTTLLVSRDEQSAVGNGESTYPSLSGDGLRLAFMSQAANLGLGHDINAASDICVYERDTGAVRRVSVASDGTQGNDDSFYPHISRDGRFVGFASSASNLVPDDTNGWPDVFVHDLLLGTTERVSLSESGLQGNATSFRPRLSGDGRLLAFGSAAMTLVPGDGNAFTDVFVHDRQGPFGLLPGGVAGSLGQPLISGSGHAIEGYVFGFDVSGAPPLAPAFVACGLTLLEAPCAGGTLVPQPDLLLALTTSSLGRLGPQAFWPAGVAEGTRLFLQAFVQDAGAPQGWAVTDGLWLVTP